MQAPHPDAFQFGVMGDAPYYDSEEIDFVAMMGEMNREPLAFVVHVGDFKAGSDAPCTDALYVKRKAQFDGLAHPFFFTPGDNDWVDCRRESNGGSDALERLAKLRVIFFTHDAARDSRPRKLEATAQRECVERSGDGCRCPGLPENRAWKMKGVAFVTLHITGSNNNAGFDAASDREVRCRTRANELWLERHLRGGDWRAFVVIIHANPWIRSRERVYDGFLAQIANGAKTHARPVLLVHGDTHIHRVDKPFRDASGKPIENLTRLETFGSPMVGWVRVTADPAQSGFFRFAPGKSDF